MLKLIANFCFAIAAGAVMALKSHATPALPPKADKVETRLKKHGDTRIDNYFWLRERDNTKVLDYLNSENNFVASVMKPTEKLQEKLVKEFRSRIKEDDQSAPYKRDDFYYYSRYEIGQEYPIFARKNKSLKAAEEIMLNVNQLAKGHKYYDLGRATASRNHEMLAYAVDTVGRRFYDLHFKNLKTKKTLGDIIPQTTGNVVWLNDNKTILFSKQDSKTLRAYQVYKYTLGSKLPELIYEEKDPEFYVSVSKSLTHEYVYINSISNSANEVRLAKADNANPEFTVFMARRPKHEYNVFDGGDRFYILTNLNAKNFRLVETAKDKLAPKLWQDVMAHNPKVYLEDVLVLQNHIVAQTRKNGLTELTYFIRTGSKNSSKKRSSINFPDPTYITGIGVNAEYTAQQFRYDYQSMTQPASIYDFDLVTGETTLVKKDNVPTYKSEHYISERIWAKAHDGIKVPISLVYRKDKFKAGANPIFVYSYGSYGLNTDTYFRRNIVSLLDRGFVFATPHIRGGSDLGREWYDNGKMLKKKNTFKDFISATEHLVKKKYGHKDKVYAMGGSAGGLLMGAVMNMNPKLFRGIIASVPFVDVISTMLDDTIPLTTNEYQEWGNPNEKKYYKYMKSYSPYDNVKKQAYPNLLVTTGFHDSQVQYWEPAKWVAKLREMNTSNNLILFKTDMSSGHSGTTGRFEALKEDALEYAFLIMLEGVND